MHPITGVDGRVGGSVCLYRTAVVCYGTRICAPFVSWPVAYFPLARPASIKVPVMGLASMGSASFDTEPDRQYAAGSVKGNRNTLGTLALKQYLQYTKYELKYHRCLTKTCFVQKGMSFFLQKHQRLCLNDYTKPNGQRTHL